MSKTDAKYSHYAGKVEIGREGVDGICLVHKIDQFLGAFAKL